MARVLVTGGAGFIGSHLVERLLGRGDEVICLDDFNDFYDPRRKRANLALVAAHPGFHLEVGDIRDPLALDRAYRHGIDATIHLAARAGVRPSIVDPVLYEEVNALGTLNVLDAARRHGARVFVLGSSSSVYGINAKVPFGEDDPISHPVSPYAVTKRAGELMAFSYHHLHGLRVTVLRFFTVYGPRQRPEMAIHRFAEHMLRGESVPRFGDGSSARDYTYVDDIVDGIVAGLDAAATFEIVNLGGAHAVALQRLIELIGAAVGVTPRIENLPDQPGDVPVTFADVTRARALWGWQPRVPIEEGLERFVAWLRQQVP